jgi:hypothetical protein
LRECRVESSAPKGEAVIVALFWINDLRSASATIAKHGYRGCRQLTEIEVMQRHPSPARGVGKCALEMLKAMPRFSIYAMEPGQVQRRFRDPELSARGTKTNGFRACAPPAPRKMCGGIRNKKEPPETAAQGDNREASNRVDRSHSMSRRWTYARNERESLTKGKGIAKTYQILFRFGVRYAWNPILKP